MAPNNMQCLEYIEKAVVELVKNGSGKLNNTNNQSNKRVPNPLIPRAQVVVRVLLLLPGAPNHCGASTIIHNPGHLPQNVPPANLPAGQSLTQAQPGCNPPQGQILPAVQHVVPALPANNPTLSLNVPLAQ